MCITCHLARKMYLVSDLLPSMCSVPCASSSGKAAQMFFPQLVVTHPLNLLVSGTHRKQVICLTSWKALDHPKVQCHVHFVSICTIYSPTKCPLCPSVLQSTQKSYAMFTLCTSVLSTNMHAVRLLLS